MPTIFDNIEERLLPALKQSLAVSYRADYCVGYFNLRGWRQLDAQIEPWLGEEGNCCRILVGMQRMPQEELRSALRLTRRDEELDNQTALRLKRRLAEEFREQLILGAPTDEDEAGLRRLVTQIRTGKVVVKLYLRTTLHAKLYLHFRKDQFNPILGYLGSSNLTFAGLIHQGELNIDVLDKDACQKLAVWFESRWNDRWCVDISEELTQIIEESWAREELIPPYHIYVKMAYHLSQEARAGLSEFRIPSIFRHKLFDFQAAAVKIAAHHLNKRGGVLIGDVVGLGKTLMATALASIFEEDYFLETLIICPKNLVKMWENYRDEYRLRAKVLPISQAMRSLPDLRRYRLVLIDESHNLRNRDGKRYRAIQEYIQANDSKVILLSATPYNKTYDDLSSQLRLFLKEDKDIGVRPERLLREIGETEFIRRHQSGLRTLAAFEKSPHADDWRDLMRLYLIRRTRSFIKDNYAETDTETGRKYLLFEDGTRSFFPKRDPRRIEFEINDRDPNDQYARLYAENVVEAINQLWLPRYGLGHYVSNQAAESVTPDEQRVLDNLSRARQRLKGFSRTNLFKRLESSGAVFLQSIERHILRNYIYLHAIEHSLSIPIGTQDVALLDSRLYDEDADATLNSFDDEEDIQAPTRIGGGGLRTDADFKQRAADIYQGYDQSYHRRFTWLRPSLFSRNLAKHLRDDATALIAILQQCGSWDARQDAKLAALVKLLTHDHPNQKVLIFSQFADTVSYLDTQLQRLGIPHVAGVSAQSADPTGLAWRFSPKSNDKQRQVAQADELRVLVATDLLSEGQNLQDSAIVVNFDLPWAIIRLIQRAGRIDRIGQTAEHILCYTFLPAEGVERILRLRARIRQRLQENAEVIGTDEAFFEDDHNDQAIRDLFTEKAGILDGDDDSEVDLASYAYQIWKNAITDDPKLQRIIPNLPSVAYATKGLRTFNLGVDTDAASTRTHNPLVAPEGVLVYLRTTEGNDALAWIDRRGNNVTESQLAILKAAECLPDTQARLRHPQHHELVQRGIEQIMEEERSVGGQLGRPSGARFRTYERLKHYSESLRGTLFESQELLKAIDEIYRYPLRQSAIDKLNRQLKSGVDDKTLAELVLALRDDDALCVVEEEAQEREPQIICSMGLFQP